MRKLRQYINEIGNITTLKQYINEAGETDDTIKEVTNLTATWVSKDKTYIEAPEKYSESDLQIYLDDTMLEELPGGANAEKFFGKNSDNIVDAYMAYDSMDEAMGEDQEPDIKWDSRYDSKTTSDDKLHVVCINNLKYVVVFDKFELVDVNDEDVKSKLIDIMTVTNSNNTNQYPIELTFDSKNIEYTE